MKADKVIEQSERYYLPVFGRYPIVLDHGKGCKVYDADGEEYIDFLAGIAVNCLGYGHPVLSRAIAEQAAKLMHCSNLYYTEIQAKAVKIIAEVSGMDRVFLANSGAEANEGAMKLARRLGVSKDPAKFKIISADHSFHGRTFDTLAATGHDYYRVGYGPLPPGHVFVPYDDIEALEAAMDENVCGVLLEPVQGEGGVHVPAPDYFKKVRALCDKYDALLLMDEIQTGVGRIGSWFAYMQTGTEPDVLTFAKGIGGGFPMGGFAVKEKFAHVFQPGDHGSTFGGNALACAAACAALTAVKAENLVERAAEQGAYFKKRLQETAAKFPEKVKEVRGKGLLLGLELYKPGKAIVESCLKDHVIVNCTAGNVIRLVPPLIVSKEEIDAVCTALERALAVF